MAAEEQPKGGTAVSSGEAIAAGSATGNGSEKPVAIPATSTENRRAEDMSESKNQGDIQGELGKVHDGLAARKCSKGMSLNLHRMAGTAKLAHDSATATSQAGAVPGEFMLLPHFDGPEC